MPTFINGLTIRVLVEINDCLQVCIAKPSLSVHMYFMRICDCEPLNYFTNFHYSVNRFYGKNANNSALFIVKLKHF